MWHHHGHGAQHEASLFIFGPVKAMVKHMCGRRYYSIRIVVKLMVRLACRHIKEARHENGDKGWLAVVIPQFLINIIVCGSSHAAAILVGAPYSKRQVSHPW